MGEILVGFSRNGNECDSALVGVKAQEGRTRWKFPHAFNFFINPTTFNMDKLVTQAEIRENYMS